MMSTLPARLLWRMPSFMKRQAVSQLFGATAAAFGCTLPRLSGLSHEQCLHEYALFTAGRAAEAMRSGSNLAGLQHRLYHNAYGLGRFPGRLLRARTVADVMALGRVLYSLLQIDFQGSQSGDITIGRCYFSRFYSPAVCGLMSAMDCGLLAGLAGGGELVFSQRITEGHACCRARFAMADRIREQMQ